jgi:hypothetical protein
VNRKRFVGGETVDVGKIDNAPGHAVPFFLFFKSEEKKKAWMILKTLLFLTILFVSISCIRCTSDIAQEIKVIRDRMHDFLTYPTLIHILNEKDNLLRNTGSRNLEIAPET